MLKLNILANFVGRGWQIFFTILILPVYVGFLGLEAYGLVGFFASLQAVLIMSDVGLKATLTREMARCGTTPAGKREAKDILKTIELVFWVIVISISVLVLAFSSYIATDWVNPVELSPESIRLAVSLMGIAIIFQFVADLYQGALIGLQRQVLLNGIVVTMGTFRAAITIFVLWKISSSVVAFFVCQIAANMLQMIWVRIAVGRELTVGGYGGRFDSSLIRKNWTYASGMFALTITSTILLQADKVILSRMLTLEMFGLYTLAWLISRAPITVMSSPVYQAVFPYITNLLANERYDEIKSIYHTASQSVAVMVAPFACLLGLFSYEIVFAWIGNPTSASQMQVLVSLFSIGSLITGIMVIPFALVLAHGWPGLSVKINACSIVVLVPLLIWLTSIYGPVGAAITWILLNVVSLLVFVGVMHRYILVGELREWYVKDIGMPIVSSLIVILLLKFNAPVFLLRFESLYYLAGVWVLGTGAALAVSPRVRNLIREIASNRC